MPFIRAIGRWTLAALVINCIIGGGIFGVPGELSRLLGRASPLAMVFAAIGMAVILACMTEVACRFAEPGGPYLYVRTAFGQFLGTQVGWFHLLANVGAMAALAVLFLDYLPAVLPVALNRWERGAILAILLAIPAAVNYIGVRRGAVLNNLTTVAKLLPLTLLIVAGLAYVVKQPQTIDASEVLCASLLPLRRMRSSPGSFQLPFGPLFSGLGVAISVGLMFGLARWQLLLMLVTALIATINWVWARHANATPKRKMKAA